MSDVNNYGDVIKFKTTSKIDKIQLSIGLKHFSKVKQACDQYLELQKKVGNKNYIYISKKDRMIYYYLANNIRIEITRYQSRKKTCRPCYYFTLKMYNPTIEVQKLIIETILKDIPCGKVNRRLSNIEFALDFYPEVQKEVLALQKILQAYITIPYARNNNIIVMGHCYTIGEKKDAYQLIIYPKPKDGDYTHLRLEIRFYEDSVSRHYKDNRDYLSPINTVTVLDHVEFRKRGKLELINRIFRKYENSLKPLARKITYGLIRTQLSASTRKDLLYPTSLQIYFYRKAKKIGVPQHPKADRVHRYFEKFPEIRQDITQGFVKRSYEASQPPPG